MFAGVYSQSSTHETPDRLCLAVKTQRRWSVTVCDTVMWCIMP